MGAYAEKICIALQEPSADAPGDSRTRLLDALGREHVRVTLSALQVLYPAIRDGRGRVTVTLSPADEGWELVRVEPGDTSQRLFALALDIGTTTLEMELLHLPDGAVLSRAGCFNGQCAVGDNILDRIFYAKDEPEHLRHLQELVLESIRGLIAQCCEQAAVRPEEIAALGAAGNTTMMHLLLGCEPWQIFQSPYTPVFLDPGVHSARELGLSLDCNIFCMPAVANYLGGDITSGLLLTDLDARDDPAVFLDVGTNGELALGCREYLLAGAGAAGPALEGAVSKSGMRAEPGAVCRVRIDAENRLHYETIGGAAPKGICGSGIVDLLAEGYLSGWISGDGSLNPDASPQIRPVWEEDSHRNVPAIIYAMSGRGPLYFTQDDIAEFIRCKAADGALAIRERVEEHPCGDLSDPAAFAARYTVCGREGEAAEAAPQLREMFKELERVTAGEMESAVLRDGTLSIALNTKYAFAEVPAQMDMRDLSAVRKWYTATLQGMCRILDVLLKSGLPAAE